MSEFASLMHIIHYYFTLDICHLFLLCQSTADLSQLTVSTLSSFLLPSPFQCPIASPNSVLHNPSIQSDGGRISGLCFCNIVRWEHWVTKNKLYFPQSYVLGFWNQIRLHHVPNSEIIILPAGLWFSKEKISGKGKAVLLKMVVILYISSHSLCSLLSLWDHKHQRLTLIHPIREPLPTRYLSAEFSQDDA